MRWVAAILVACVCTHAAGREEDGLSAVELDALFSLKALLTYDPSGQVWQTWHGKPCHKDPWVGVECEASLTGKHVVGLDFPALGLKSSNLPEELGNLTKLRMLRLGRDWGNAFQGGPPKIPVEQRYWCGEIGRERREAYAHQVHFQRAWCG